MKTLIKRGWVSITVIVLGFALFAITALSATRAVADVVYQDNRETISVTLLPYNQEYSYCEDGSFSPKDFVVLGYVSRDKSGVCTKKIYSLGMTGSEGVKWLSKPACRFDNEQVDFHPYSSGTLYNVCKNKGPIDVTIEQPLKISMYDKKNRLVREVSAGSATALVHCPEIVPAHPPTGSAPRVLTGSSCTRGIDCPPRNNSMALGGNRGGGTQGNTSSQPICTQTASEAGTEQPANAIDPIPRTWQKPRVVNRVPLAGERTVSSPRIKALPQRAKPVTPQWQAPRPVNRGPVAVARTASSPGVRAPAPGARSVTTSRQTPGQRGIIVGTARESGTRGIVVGTCRDLQKRPIRNPVVGNDGTGRLLFPLSDGRTMVLPDGIYKDNSGIRIHMLGGRIVMVDGILPRRR